MEYIQKKISNTENVRNIFLRFFFNTENVWKFLKNFFNTENVRNIFFKIFFLTQKMSGNFFNTENVRKFQKFLIQKMSGKFLDKFQIYSIKMKLTWSLHKLDLLKKLHCFVHILYTIISYEIGKCTTIQNWLVSLIIKYSNL